jgi:hypothetical protein
MIFAIIDAADTPLRFAMLADDAPCLMLPLSMTFSLTPCHYAIRAMPLAATIIIGGYYAISDIAAIDVAVLLFAICPR